MNDRFELGLIVGTNLHTHVALGALLDLDAQGEPWPDVRAENTTLYLECGGRDWMPLKWVLGDLPPLGRQCAAAAARLRAGQIALVRCAVDDRDPVAYFAFVPDATGRTAISLAYPPGNLRFVYPTSPARGAGLYAWAEANPDELLARSGPPDPYDIVQAPFATGALIDALERESARAAAVAELLAADARGA